MEIGRLAYQKPDKYRQEVLIGNWFEKRLSYKKTSHEWKTSYTDHYPEKPYSANNPSLVWDQLFKSHGLGARVLFDHQAPHFIDNMTTIYDLAYNHIPKLSDGPIPRTLRFRFLRYEPEQDFAKCHGNITKSGLLDFYKEKWRCEVSDPRITMGSLHQDTFVPPKKDEYCVKRSARPRSNSSAMLPQNQTNAYFRGKLIAYVPEEGVVVVPQQPRCNPITWECPDELKGFDPCSLSRGKRFPKRNV